MQWAPWLLRMNRPGEKITRRKIQIQKKMKDLDRKDKSKSLMANIVDTDDDFHPMTKSHMVHPSHPGTNICMTRSITQHRDTREILIFLLTVQVESKFKQPGIWESNNSAPTRVWFNSEGNSDHHRQNKRRWRSLCSRWRLEVCSDGSWQDVPYILHNIHYNCNLCCPSCGSTCYRQVIWTSTPTLHYHLAIKYSHHNYLSQS